MDQTVTVTNIDICRVCGEKTEEPIQIFDGSIKNLNEKINQYLPIKVTCTDTLSLILCITCTNTLLSFEKLVLNCIAANKFFESIQKNAKEKFQEDCLIFVSDYCNNTDLDIDNISHISVQNDEPNNDEHKFNEFTDIDPSPGKFRRKKKDINLQFFCEECPNGYSRKYDLERHQHLKHNQKTETLKPKSKKEFMSRCKFKADTGEAYYKCDLCLKLFSRSYNFLRHYFTHSEQRDFCCHICGSSFKVAESLNRHIKISHDKVKDFQCEECDLRFANKQSLGEHMNTHSDNRPYVCDVCGAAFRQRVTLARHIMSHSEDNYKHECVLCKKMFRTLSEVKAHQRTHLDSRPFKCGVCGMEFRYKNVMQRHSKLHDESSEFICDVCGKSFTQERYLVTHKSKHQN